LSSKIQQKFTLQVERNQFESMHVSFESYDFGMKVS